MIKTGLFLIFGISIFALMISTPSFAEEFVLRGHGISLDSNLDDPLLYKSSLRLEFNSLSEITKGSVILRSVSDTVAARMIPNEWTFSYNADGSFIGSGQVRTLQDTYYEMTINGERKFTASNWSLWEAVGSLEGNNEKYSLKFIVSGDDRFSLTPEPLITKIVIPTGNAFQIEDASYIPEYPTVFRGTTVIWENHDSVEHTVQSQDGQGNVISIFNSNVLQAGDSFDYQFNEPGVYDYLCTLHPWRTGTITVI